jgi:hypothetical protein
MKRNALFCFLLLICLTSSGIAFDQSDSKSDSRPAAKKTCPFNIVGMWKSEAMNDEINPTFFLFLPDGWVRVMGQTANALPEEFEIVAEVRYKTDKSDKPKYIEFTSEHGNDAFGQGITMMDIAEFSEDSFTTVDTNGQKSRWDRIQTHRYFLTFAARSVSAQQGGPAFAMVTTLDGRREKVEAIGVEQTKDETGKVTSEFRLISDKLYEQFKWESDKESDVMMRVEVSRTEYERIHELFDTWTKLIKDKKLLHDDPYMNVMDFLPKVVERLNVCGEKIKPPQTDKPAANETVSKQILPLLPLEYIRAMRKKNDARHIMNSMFPTGWTPMQSPVKQ